MVTTRNTKREQEGKKGAVLCDMQLPVGMTTKEFSDKKGLLLAGQKERTEDAAIIYHVLSYPQAALIKPKTRMDWRELESLLACPQKHGNSR